MLAALLQDPRNEHEPSQTERFPAIATDRDQPTQPRIHSSNPGKTPESRAGAYQTQAYLTQAGAVKQLTRASACTDELLNEPH